MLVRVMIVEAGKDAGLIKLDSIECIDDDGSIDCK